MFIFQSCDINENQLMVAKELDFIVKNEPKEDEDWYVTEVVNVCSDCAEKNVLIDNMAKQLKYSEEKITELETAMKRMKDAYTMEIDDWKMKMAKSDDKKEEFYEVECLLDHKIVGKKQTFLVKWHGYDDSHNSWVEQKNLHCKKILQKYLKTKNLI